MKIHLTLAFAITCFVSPLLCAQTNFIADNSHPQTDLNATLQQEAQNAQNSYRQDKVSAASVRRREVLERCERVSSARIRKLCDFLTIKHQLIENHAAGTNTDTEEKALDFYRKGQFIQAYQTLGMDLVDFFDEILKYPYRSLEEITNSVPPYQPELINWLKLNKNWHFESFQWPIQYQFETARNYVKSFHVARHEYLQRQQNLMLYLSGNREEKDCVQYNVDYFTKLIELNNRHTIHTTTPEDEKIISGLKHGWFSSEYYQAVKDLGFDRQKLSCGYKNRYAYDLFETSFTWE